MSTPTNVVSALKTLLENDSNVSYFKNVFLGDRETVTQFPALFIEPTGIVETENVYPRQDLSMNINLTGVVQCHDADKQIVGDANSKGILDVLNDIELAIDSDRTLSGNAIHTRVARIDFGRVDSPIRFVTLQLEILFRQTKGTRS